MAVAGFNDTFLKSCRREPTDYTPVWFMRQAGRSLPGYRKLREKYDVLTLTQTPELAAVVSLEPIERLGVDAAILFADIMLLPLAMGVDLKIIDSVGPIISDPIDHPKKIKRFQALESEKIEYLGNTIKILRRELKVPLIGFSAAPFTLASYLIEGRPTRDWVKTKRFMLEQQSDWADLMEILSEAIIKYLHYQINAGVQAVQIFDSWVGCLSASDYRQYVLPYAQRIFSSLRETGVPRIHFGTNTAAMLKDFADVDCEVISLDWRIDLPYAKKLIGGKAIQGNLDPVVLLSDIRAIEAKTDVIFDSLPSREGYIFNLGHGVLPQSSDELLKHLVDYVHAK